MSDGCNTINDVIRTFVPEKLWNGHLVATTSGIYETLDGFDISTHMKALDRNGNPIYGRRYTPPEQHPKVYLENARSGMLSAARYQKVCRRYGHVEDGDTFRTILKGWIRR